MLWGIFRPVQRRDPQNEREVCRQMIDIHCHILPGMDDGAGNLADAAEMAELAVSSGVTDVVVTPHSNVPGMPGNFYGPPFEERLWELKNELSLRNIPLGLHPGQEIFLSSESVCELLKDGKLIGLNRSRYVLTELDMAESRENALGLLRALRESGFVPVVAHPERYGFVIRDPDSVSLLRREGCLVQLNRGSILGRFGPGVRRAAHRILRRRWADFVGSDGHSPYSRTPYLADVDELLRELYGPEYADLLTRENPRSVLEDRPVRTLRTTTITPEGYTTL